MPYEIPTLGKLIADGEKDIACRTRPAKAAACQC